MNEKFTLSIERLPASFGKVAIYLDNALIGDVQVADFNAFCEGSSDQMQGMRARKISKEEHDAMMKDATDIKTTWLVDPATLTEPKS